MDWRPNVFFFNGSTQVFLPLGMNESVPKCASASRYSCELESQFPASPLVTPIMVPSAVAYLPPPLRSSDYGSWEPYATLGYGNGVGKGLSYTIVPLGYIESGVYGDLITRYPKPYSIYLRATISKIWLLTCFHRKVQGKARSKGADNTASAREKKNHSGNNDS